MAVALGDWKGLRSELLIVGLYVAAASVQAAEAPAQPGYRADVQAWAEQSIGNMNAGDTRLRYEIRVGELDSRLKLAPCGAVEYYLPSGVRLWGKSRVGMRCTDGMSRWNVFVPLVVKAMAPAWVVKGTIPVGAVLKMDDAVLVEVDWAEETAAVLPARGDWVGQLAARPLVTGQVLRQGMLKAAQVFQAGASVRVLAQGPGFQATADAQALSAGVVGQVVRVRMDNGRVASGLVLDARTVKMDL